MYYNCTGLAMPKGMQMGIRQVAQILKSLKETPNANLLVWGLGYDSKFWHKRVPGNVVFLEDNPEWYNNITENSELQAFIVNYNTQSMRDLKKYSLSPNYWYELDVRNQLPSYLLNTMWHVIIIDGPRGGRNGIGRYQSIYTSKLLVAHQYKSHIFLDDCNRIVESIMGDMIFGAENKIGVETRGKNSNRNKQCHYLLRG